MKKIYKVMSSAALAAILLGGAAWGNAEAANAKEAAKNTASSSPAQKVFTSASVTQSGITLEISKAVYDGNYVSITLQRSGKELAGSITGGKWDEKIKEYVQEKGAINKMEVFIDGKSIYEYGGGGLAKRPSLGTKPGANADSVSMIISDASQLGGNLEAFPDKFKVTAKISLEGVEKPYTLEIPIQKNAVNPVVLKPNLTKKSGNLSMTLNQVHATSTSTRLQLILKGQEKNSTILHDFVDDQGNKLDLISGKGTDENNTNSDYYYDFILDALDKDAKSITIKSFTPEFKEPNATHGEFKLDSEGEIVKNYIEELEMTVPVK
ncbi:DUF5643 domain-containing protein [Paenibacillus lautus]|uniref:DUF5643 domain-containing protein n=1 Tax=Paenibacillus lautus TaxID=1401 RepID=UPI003D2801B6